MEKFKDGDHVTFGRMSVGVYRGINEQGLAKVNIGLDVDGKPLIAIVPVDELTLED